MKRILAPLLISMTLAACQGIDQIDPATLTPEERGAVEALAWLKDADASRDVAQAIQRGDKRLLAMATRGPNMPGVPAESASKAKMVCGIRYVEGSTDAVLGDAHLKLLQAAHKYAAEYNQLMLDACLKQRQ